jgi:peroxiredoxin Q/BCP
MPRRSGGTWLAATLLALAAVSGGARSAHAQAAASPAPAAIAVGQTAPDFALPGATRYGSLAAPVKLSDFRGQVVVIAFFYKARTKG